MKLNRTIHNFGDDGGQGSPEWLSFRLGKISGSGVDKIITPTGKRSAQTDAYLAKLVAQRLEIATEIMLTDAMQRGIDLEPQARMFCEHTTKTDIKQVGCVGIDGTNIICSPDGIIYNNDKITGIYEAKCPNAENHIVSLINKKLPAKYKPQVMFNMWVCEAEYAYYHSFHPTLKSLIIKVNRDDKFIDELEDLVADADSVLNRYIKRFCQ